MINKRSSFLLAALSAAGFLIAGCGGSSNNDNSSTTETEDGSSASFTVENIPSTYTFTSKFDASQSAVSYTGQTKRHILIEDLVDYMLALEDTADQNVITDLDFFFRYDSAASDSLNYTYALSGQTVTPGPNYGAIASGKNLVAKIAGNDPALIGGEFFGWERGLSDSSTPEDLVELLFADLAALATDETSEVVPIEGGITGDIIEPYVSALGVDYRQLIQKFLLGAVTYSQATGDYLKADYSVNNDAQEDGTKPYSVVEHEWDEAFGYFGAARNYNDYTDEEIAGKSGRIEFQDGYNDINGDGVIDLLSEVNLGNATNCAKRDLGAQVDTNFTKTAFDAFLVGRTILNSTTDNLNADELAALQEAALTASLTWEKCIAATVIHYINDTLSDMNDFVDDRYDSVNAFKDHAKHWSEMKGFALGLQFNPDSPFRANAESLTKLKDVLALMGDAPVLADGTQNGAEFAGGVPQYQSDLETARSIMQDVYGFDELNVLNW